MSARRRDREQSEVLRTAEAAILQNQANRFLLDVLRLSTSLDGIRACDDLDRIMRALSHGRQWYVALIWYRDGLRFAPGDEALVDSLLNKIRARLRFVERLQRNKSRDAMRLESSGAEYRHRSC